MIVSRARLGLELFGADAGDDDFDHLAVVIARVRRKLEPDPHFPRYFPCVDSEAIVFDPSGFRHLSLPPNDRRGRRAADQR
jgi:hypothetical protein